MSKPKQVHFTAEGALTIYLYSIIGDAFRLDINGIMTAESLFPALKTTCSRWSHLFVDVHLCRDGEPLMSTDSTPMKSISIPDIEYKKIVKKITESYIEFRSFSADAVELLELTASACLLTRFECLSFPPKKGVNEMKLSEIQLIKNADGSPP